MNINIITDKIISDAQREAELIVKEANAKAEGIKQVYLDRAEAVKAENVSDAEREAAAIKEMAQASLKTSERNNVLFAKSALLDSAFKKAEEKILSFDSEKYFEFMSAMLKKALVQQCESEKRAILEDTEGEITLCGQYSLEICEKDAAIAEKLLEIGSELLSGYGKSLVLSDKGIKASGGFYIICGEIQIDCTISSVIESLKQKLSHRVLEILFEA